MSDWPLHDSIRLWIDSGIRMLPGRRETEICTVLRGLRRPYCADVIRLYELTGGMFDHEYGQGVFSLWSLERLQEENRNSKSNLLLFGDFLISSHYFGFSKGPSGTSSVHIEHFAGETIPVARSPQEFFRKYLERSEDLLLVWD